MKPLLSILLTLFLVLHGAAFAEQSDASSCSSEKTGIWYAEVPIEIIRDHIFAVVSINGEEGFRFLLDTAGGARSLIVRHEKTKRLKLPRTGKSTVMRMPATGSTARLYDLKPAVFSVGEGASFQLAPQEAGWRGMRFFMHEKDIYWDGIFAHDFFEKFLVEIDPRRNVMTLYDPEASLPSCEVYAATTIKRNRRGNPTARIAAMFSGMNDPIDMDVLVDTGANSTFTLSLSNRDWRRVNELTEPARRRSDENYEDRAGFILEYLALEDAVIPNVPAGVLKDQKLWGSGLEGLMGARFLNSFRYRIDFGREKLSLMDFDGAHLNRPRLPISTFPVDGSFRVTRVSKAAARAGFNRGDVIISAGGVPTDGLTIEEFDALIDLEEGETIEICIRRDAGSPHCAELTANALWPEVR